MNTDLFSILVANFNNGHFFKDCFESIINQTYQNFEVIIVDDNSTDDSVSEINELIKNDNRFKLYRKNINKGCGFTKRECARIAKGSIAAFLDPDDAIVSNALEQMVIAHKKNPQAAIVTSKYEMVDLEMTFVSIGTHGTIIPKGKSYLTYGEGALTHFASFKMKMYNQSKGINPILKRAVDQDLYYKMEEQGLHIFLDEVLYKYRVHANSISQNENLFKAHYWHYYAIRSAYKRRKKYKFEIDNMTSSIFKNHASTFYLGRFNRVKHTSKTQAKLYFITKSIIAKPSHMITHKFKSLLLVILGRI